MQAETKGNECMNGILGNDKWLRNGYPCVKRSTAGHEQCSIPNCLCCWCPFALLPYSCTVDVEKNGNRKEDYADERQKTTCPRYTKVVVHGMRKQWEERACERANEGIDRDGTVGIEAIAVDEVAHTLPERHHAAKTEESNREHLWHPGDVGTASPGEPE